MTGVGEQQAVVQSGQLLTVWLRVVQWGYGVLGMLVVGALLLFALLPGAFLGTLSLGTSLTVLGTLLVGAWYALFLLLIGWAREWLAHVQSWAATGEAPNAARLAQLRGTLGRWITFSQWLPIVLGGALLLGGVAFGGVLGTLLASDADAAWGGLGAAALTVFFALYVVAVFAPQAVLNFLILGAVRRWLNAATNALSGLAHPPLLPLANGVSNWFIFCQVLIGLGALFGLLGGAVNVLVAALPAGGGNELGSLGVAGGIAVGLVTFVFVLAVYGSQFLLLEWSKRFALSVSRLLSRPPEETAN